MYVKDLYEALEEAHRHEKRDKKQRNATECDCGRTTGRSAAHGLRAMSLRTEQRN